MNRREALTTMAAGVFVMPVVGKTDSTPAIKFSRMRSIANLDEIFKNAQWGQGRHEDTEIQEAIAWLPCDRAVDLFDPRRAFYGLVKVVRYRYKKDMPHIKANTATFSFIEQLAESCEEYISDEDHTFFTTQIMKTKKE